MSHEILTPMTAILGYADLLREPGPSGRSDPAPANDSEQWLLSARNH
ncbi:MAG: hypothetical protein KDB01_07585 [Planctomycetaceae bacterium]|nr:hypothetical protein [Planctomycetaceae bacterium]